MFKNKIIFLLTLSQPVRARAMFAALAFLICLFAAQSAQAQLTFTVTRTDDRNMACVSGVDCSLREAVNAANAAATNDTINFAIPAASCPASVCTITLTLGELAVNDAATAGTLTITNSTGASNLLISGNNRSRVFYLNTDANLTINGVTITKGNGTGTTNSGFNGFGGGIANSGGTLTLTNSIVSGNTSSGNSNGGGGIYNNDSGTSTLTNSTVSGNTASDRGGGIFNLGTLTLINSTVSGNMASLSGGGINNFGTLNLTSVTVTQNKSTDATCTTCAGGIENGFGIATLKNTIVAGNTVANAASSPDFRGAVAAGSSFNLIGNGQGTTGISNGDANSNQVGVDPMLDPTLQLNGGTTANHALLAGSPAIDKGNSFGLTTDQRGLPRPVDNPPITNTSDGADIGAFEVQAPTAATVSVGGRVMTAAGRGISKATVSVTDGGGNVLTTAANSFGYYNFAELPAGDTYIFSVRAKHYQFAQPSQVVSVSEDQNDVNFTAFPEQREFR